MIDPELEIGRPTEQFVYVSIDSVAGCVHILLLQCVMLKDDTREFLYMYVRTLVTLGPDGQRHTGRDFGAEPEGCCMAHGVYAVTHFFLRTLCH